MEFYLMDECPKCGKWLIALEAKYGRIKCYNPDCDYEKKYCMDQWYIEHDALPSLVGEKRILKCNRVKDTIECKKCKFRILGEMLE